MIIGLHGKMRAGKNEAARRLVALSPLPVVEVSFAAKLKLSAAALFDTTVSALEELKNDPDCYVTIEWRNALDTPTLTMRSFLQRYGTEAHRDIFGSDFWLDAALPLKSPGGSVVGADFYSDALYVVTDVRFENEIERVHELGGTVVLVVGPDTDTGDHASERIFHDDVDLLLDNTARDDGYASLDRQLTSLVRYMTERQTA